MDGSVSRSGIGVAAAPHRSGARARRQRGAAIAATALVLAAAAAAPAQETPAAPTAGEILARAIAAQGLPPGRDPAADLPLALRAKVNLQYTSEQGDVISVDAERRFLGGSGGPDRIWTRAVPTADRESETIVAFDGETPWLWSRKAGLRRLDQPGGENDRRQLQHDLETTALLTRAFLLRNLPAQLEDLRRLEDVSAWGHTAWVIEGSARIDRGGEPRRVALRLYVDQANGWLLGARVSVEREEPLQICLTKHERVDGVVVPGRIELYWNDEPEPRQTFYVSKLELAPKLRPEEFAPPGR